MRQCRKPVHPRVCGELLVDGVKVRFKRRFIPACAGNSSIAPPRLTMAFGSSPRVRGTRAAEPRSRHEGRFIPACAGNSYGRSLGKEPKPVHPRVCGELLGAYPEVVESPGSSPRVRGTPDGCAARFPRRRFIPACAGNSVLRRKEMGADWVHPRVCGELCVSPEPPLGRSGSSPRVRGTHRPALGLLQRLRFIPACAGNSAAPTERAPIARGSSPRVRGTRVLEAWRG